MIGRKKHRWIVALATPGQNVDYELSTYWDPYAEDAEDQVMVAARIQAWWESKKKKEFIPLSARLVS